MRVRRQSQKASGHQPVSLALIEQLLKEGFLPLAGSLAPRLSVSGAIAAIVIGLGWGLVLLGGGRRSNLSASLQDLVELTPIKPNTPALRAVVYLQDRKSVV